MKSKKGGSWLWLAHIGREKIKILGISVPTVPIGPRRIMMRNQLNPQLESFAMSVKQKGMPETVSK
jgi:hypothetical protein